MAMTFTIATMARGALNEIIDKRLAKEEEEYQARAKEIEEVG